MVDEEERFQKLLAERLRHYGDRDKEQDFRLVIESKFLDKFSNITKRLRRPVVALVSTNGPWITFMKLRLDRVLSGNFESDSLEEALASNPANLQFVKPEKWVAPYLIKSALVCCCLAFLGVDHSLSDFTTSAIEMHASNNDETKQWREMINSAFASN